MKGVIKNIDSNKPTLNLPWKDIETESCKHSYCPQAINNLMHSQLLLKILFLIMLSQNSFCLPSKSIPINFSISRLIFRFNDSIGK